MLAFEAAIFLFKALCLTLTLIHGKHITSDQFHILHAVNSGRDKQNDWAVLGNDSDRRNLSGHRIETAVP